jgi:hypothetical protein
MINNDPYTPLLAISLFFVAEAAGAADLPNAEYIRKLIPDKVAEPYKNGELIKLTVGGRNAYLIKPKGRVDPDRR